MTAILELDRVSKRFGGLQAVHDLSFAMREGEILGPDRPERRRQVDAVQSAQWRVHAGDRPDRVRRHRYTGAKPYLIARRGSRAHATRSCSRSPT